MSIERGYEGGRAGILLSFKIHDIEITGFFNVCFSNNKWCIEKITIEDSVVSRKDYEKLKNALENKIEVNIECTHYPRDQKSKHGPNERVQHGKGKAKIISLNYDESRPVLKDISFELVEWTLKDL
jgi:hypothetical protein